jgi:hypothetical protein
MLANSLSLDDEEAVQTELRALQQEAVSILCLISKKRAQQSLVNPTSSVTRSGKRRNTAHSPRSTYFGPCIFGTYCIRGEQKTRRREHDRTRRDTCLGQIAVQARIHVLPLIHVS